MKTAPDDHKLLLRLPRALFLLVEEDARTNFRDLNSTIIFRLAQHYEWEVPRDGNVDKPKRGGETP